MHPAAKSLSYRVNMLIASSDLDIACEAIRERTLWEEVNLPLLTPTYEFVNFKKWQHMI